MQGISQMQLAMKVWDQYNENVINVMLFLGQKG